MKTFSQFLAEEDDYYRPNIRTNAELIVKRNYDSEIDYLDKKITNVFSKIDKKLTDGLTFWCGDYEINDNNNFDISLISPVESQFDFKKFDFENFQKAVNEEFVKSGERLEMTRMIKNFSLTLYRIPEFTVNTETTWFVGSDLIFSSLLGIHKKILTRRLNVFNAKLIKSGGLGILLIKDLKKFDIGESTTLKTTPGTWAAILHKHFLGGRDVLDCQEELIKAGFKEYAKL